MYILEAYYEKKKVWSIGCQTEEIARETFKNFIKDSKLQLLGRHYGILSADHLVLMESSGKILKKTKIK